MKLPGRIFLIGLAALIAGVVYNQLTPNGISWNQLKLIMPSSYNVETQSVSADSSLMLMFEETALFVDIRPAFDYNIDHIPTSISIPYRSGNFDSLPERAHSQYPVILYDYQANTKEVRAFYKTLEKMGVKPLLILDGGFANWIEKGYPAEIGTTLK